MYELLMNKNPENDHWKKNAQALLRGVMAYLAEINKPTTPGSIARYLFNDVKTGTELIHEMNSSKNNEVKDLVQHFNKLSEKEVDGIFATLCSYMDYHSA